MEFTKYATVTTALAMLAACGCSSSSGGNAQVNIQNSFDPTMVPWTICQSSYMGVSFGKILLGQTSATQSVPVGLDYVLMVAAWNDPTCSPQNCLPIATENQEETVSGQTRTITLEMDNHQGPCPPEGVPPIPEAQYDRILAMWPQYGFLPYAQRAQNPECAGSGGASGDGGTDAPSDSATESGVDATSDGSGH